MKPFNRLIKSKTYHLTKLQNKLYGEVDEYLQTKKISKKAFAKELGVSKGYVSQILNGGFDHKLSKMFELSLAINKIPNIEFMDIDDYKRLKLKERLERMPLNLDELQDAYHEKEVCKKEFEYKELHKEPSLMELSF